MSSAIDRMNDGSQRPPRLRRDLNLGTLLDLPPGSSGARASLAEQLAGPGDVLSFNPELLPACIEAEGLWIHYAQRHPALAESPLRGEPSDRLADADRLWALGCEAFEAARAELQPVCA